MRRWGWCVVVLGLGALGVIAIDAARTSESLSANQATGPEQAVAARWIFGWAAFVGFVALATLASGVGDLMMSRRTRNPPRPSQEPGPPNGETAAMIDAEVNEGGPPSPIPCDTAGSSVLVPPRLSAPILAAHGHPVQSSFGGGVRNPRTPTIRRPPGRPRP
jgi:hypothetical protein